MTNEGTMDVGLYNLEHRIVNTAMMQVSQYHKDQGDDVSFYSPLFDYDRVYAFSIFDFTPKTYVKPDMVVGGTGFDPTIKLPPKIEAVSYDWSLYPDCDFSIQWYSRGCFRNCGFCQVPRKEGPIRPVEPKNLNPHGEHIKVLDNNFFGSPKWREAIKRLKTISQPVEFHQGIDIRILTDEMIDAINSLKIHKQIHFAWDNPHEDLRPKIRWLTKRIKPYRLMCYVLIGYWSTPEEDLWRIEELMKLGIDPFVMKYKKEEPYQKRIARWCNRPEIRKSCSFKDYKPTVKDREER